MPVIRNFVRFFRSIFRNVFNGVIKQFEEFSAFVKSIIYEHQDFFGPVLDAIKNDITAIIRTIETFFEGNKEIGKYVVWLVVIYSQTEFAVAEFYLNTP